MATDRVPAEADVGKPAGHWLILQYNPLTDPPPAPGTHFNPVSVEAAARKLIGWHRSRGRVPATWEEKDACENPINCLEMTFWVAAEAGVSMQEAREVVGDMAPELYAEYWEERWPPPPRPVPPENVKKTKKEQKRPMTSDKTEDAETQAQRDELERTLNESGQYRELADVQQEPLGKLDPDAETLEAHDEAWAEAEKTGEPIGG